MFESRPIWKLSADSAEHVMMRAWIMEQVKVNLPRVDIMRLMRAAHPELSSHEVLWYMDRMIPAGYRGKRLR